jgi:hypothetical protein
MLTSVQGFMHSGSSIPLRSVARPAFETTARVLSCLRRHLIALSTVLILPKSPLQRTCHARHDGILLSRTGSASYP